MIVHWFDIGMVMGLNLGRFKLNFLFVKILFGMNVEGQRNPMRSESEWVWFVKGEKWVVIVD